MYYNKLKLEDIVQNETEKINKKSQTKTKRT